MTVNFNAMFSCPAIFRLPQIKDNPLKNEINEKKRRGKGGQTAVNYELTLYFQKPDVLDGAAPHDWIFRATQQPFTRVLFAGRKGQNAGGCIPVARRLKIVAE
jgi:hypothetical protein